MKKLLIAIAGLVLTVVGYAAHSATVEEKVQVCVACHGNNGVSQVPTFPILAGQYKEYLIRALSDYKSGTRKNPIMAAQVANLSKQDIAELASYYSRQHSLATKY